MENTESLCGDDQEAVMALAIDARSRPAKVAKTLQGRDQKVKPEGEPTIAHHLTLKIGSLVEVYAPDRQDVNGRLGRISSVGEKTVTVSTTYTDLRYSVGLQETVSLVDQL